MKKLLLLITAFFLTANFVHAQDELLLRSEYEQAYKLYASNLNDSTSPENYLNMCKITYILNDKANAKEYCKSSLNEIEKEKYPDYELKSEILAMLGNIYLSAYHNNDITFDYYNQAKAYKEKNPDTNKFDLAYLYRNMANAYLNIANVSLAKEYREKALKIANDNEGKEFNNIKALVYFDYALSDKDNKDYKSYIKNLEKALEYSLNTEEYKNNYLCYRIYKNIAEYYEVISKDSKKAIDNRKKSVEETSKFPDKNLLSRDDDETDGKSIDDILTELRKYPYDIDLNIMTGSYYISKDIEKSENYFKKAINVNPTNPYVYAAIADAYAEAYNDVIKLKDIKFKAKQYIKETEKYSYYEPDIYLTLGLAYINLNDITSANKNFKKYIEYSENRHEANCETASAIWYNDENHKYTNYVILYLENAKKIQDLSPVYKLLLATVYKQKGKQKEADNTATELLQYGRDEENWFGKIFVHDKII